MTELQLGRVRTVQKVGSEAFHESGTSIGFCVEDFWRWSVSDLLSNATRGRLAEFLVAKALGICTGGVRDEWQAFDLQTPEGVRIEVKSAAFLQSWSQSRPSKISFRVPKTRAWDPATNLQSKELTRQADMYVFAFLAHTDKATIDPLDVNQWRFFILSTRVLDSRTRSQHSITLRALERLAGGSVSYHGLADAFHRQAITVE